MSVFPKGVVTAVKTALTNAPTLTYVDTVVVMKYSPEVLPDFADYCIIINPLTVQSEPYPATQRWHQLELQLVLLAKMGDRSEEDALLADNPPTNVGMLTMYEDVYTVLYGNNLGGEIELLPGLSELDHPTVFNVIQDERDTFLIEAQMGYRPRGVRWVNLS